mmetsp:Transcript_8274/g.12666  ORF Transcript_8274/g.12666 Transcript_8274/m.12666 type:complete len:93 (-) Transcript_8274:1098-1376(-)
MPFRTNDPKVSSEMKDSIKNWLKNEGRINLLDNVEFAEDEHITKLQHDIKKQSTKIYKNRQKKHGVKAGELTRMHIRDSFFHDSETTFDQDN